MERRDIFQSIEKKIVKSHCPLALLTQLQGDLKSDKPTRQQQHNPFFADSQYFQQLCPTCRCHCKQLRCFLPAENERLMTVSRRPVVPVTALVPAASFFCLQLRHSPHFWVGTASRAQVLSPNASVHASWRHPPMKSKCFTKITSTWYLSSGLAVRKYFSICSGKK